MEFFSNEIEKRVKMDEISNLETKTFSKNNSALVCI